MSYEVTSRVVTLNHDGFDVYTDIFEPQGIEAPAAGLPALICSHGFGGTSADSEPYARAIAAEGFVVATFDFCGGSPNSKSSGDLTHMSPVTECQDLACVFDHVRGLDQVDPARVCLIGFSQGGFVSCMFATKRPEDVKALMLVYPALVIPDDARKQYPTPDDVPMTYSHMGVTLGRVFAVDAMGWDPYEHLAGYAGPVHIWHGDADPVVPISYSERASKTFPNAEFTVVPGAGHGFGERRVEVIPDFIEFLKANA